MAATKKTRAKRYAVVACNEHGRESDKWDGRMLPIAIPRNKAQRRGGGCPLCASEARAVSEAA